MSNTTARIDQRWFLVYSGRDAPGDNAVQKKGKDRSRPILSSTPLLLLVALAAAFAFWFVNREQSVREISYGNLMEICKTKDPTAQFQNVVIHKGAEIK